jgi:ribosome maturation factor RimP
LRRDVLARVEELARQAAEEAGVELVDLEYSPARGHAVLRLYIDKDGGITVGDCTRVSRAVGDALDTEDPIPGSYKLEVSSPGVDMALRNERHFVRYRGRPVQLVLRRPVQGLKMVAGVIESCNGGTVKLRSASAGELVVEMDNIARGRLDIDPWERAKASGKKEHAG